MRLSEKIAMFAMAVLGIVVMAPRSVSAEDYLEYGSHYYKVFDDGESWKEAEADCEALGGYLVTVKDQNELKFIRKILTNHPKNAYWMGLKKEGKDKWTWVDGSEFTFSNWDKNQPDNFYGNEEYGMIYNKSIKYPEWACTRGAWNDCGNEADEEGDFSLPNFGYICEWDENPTQEEKETSKTSTEKTVKSFWDVVEDANNESTSDDKTLDDKTSDDILESSEETDIEALRDEVLNSYNSKIASREGELFSGKIKIDGQTMKIAAFKIGKPDNNGYPLYIALHGGGVEDDSVADEQFEVMQDYYNNVIESGIYVVPHSLNSQFDEHYLPEAFMFYDRIIEDAIAFYDVDPNRVYLMGFSSGGDGTYANAPKISDRLAAANMSAGFPNTHKLENLYNLPFCVQVGENDAAFDRNIHAMEYDGWLDECNEMYGGGFVHDTFIHVGGTHNEFWTDVFNDEQEIIKPKAFGKTSYKTSDYTTARTGAVQWMNQYTRNPVPERIVWATSEHAGNRDSYALYWLDRDGYLENTVIVASYDKSKNSINIEKCDAKKGTLKIYLNQDMVDLNDEVKVIVLGKEYTVKPIISKQVMESTLKARGDYSYMFDAEIDITFDGENVTVEAVEEHKDEYDLYGIEDNFRVNSDGLLLPSSRLFGITYEELCDKLEYKLPKLKDTVVQNVSAKYTELAEPDMPNIVFNFIDGKLCEVVYKTEDADYNKVMQSAAEVYGARFYSNGQPTNSGGVGIYTIGGKARLYMDNEKKGGKNTVIQAYVAVRSNN